MDSITNESNLNVDLGLHVIKFWAPWCGPCRMYAPVIEKLDEEFENVNFLSVDTDQVPELARKFKITSLPTLILIQDGKERRRIIGLSMIKPLRALINEMIEDYEPEVSQEEVLAEEASG